MLASSGRFGDAVVAAVAAVGLGGLATVLLTLPLKAGIRLGGLGLGIGALLVVPTMLLVVFYWRSGIPLDVQDGTFQTQIVASRLLQGHDPYGTDFTHTELVRWYAYPDGTATPHHYIYYPLVILAAVPAVALEQAFGLAADVRPFQLILAGVAFLLIVRLPLGWKARWLLATLLLLNPFFGWIEGRNDILWIAPILAAVGVGLQGRWRAAAWLVGTAAAVKVFAIPFVLFLGTVLVVRWQHGLLHRRGLWTSLLGLVVPLLATTVPFVLWNPAAFWDDTAGWVLDRGFPIYGFGLGQALLLTHLLPSPFTPFPFGLVQLGVGTPMLVLGIVAIIRRPTIEQALAAAGPLLAVLVLFGRFTMDSYIASLVFILVLAMALSRRAGEPATSLQSIAA